MLISYQVRMMLYRIEKQYSHSWFFMNTTSLNSKFSFLLTGCLTKAKGLLFTRNLGEKKRSHTFSMGIGANWNANNRVQRLNSGQFHFLRRLYRFIFFLFFFFLLVGWFVGWLVGGFFCGDRVFVFTYVNYMRDLSLWKPNQPSRRSSR